MLKENSGKYGKTKNQQPNVVKYAKMYNKNKNNNKRQQQQNNLNNNNGDVVM